MSENAQVDLPVVVTTISDRIATVTLNRPNARNAINQQLGRELRFAMATAEADSDVDVVVLTGSDPAFCAGIDLKELGSTGRTGVFDRDDSGDVPLPGRESGLTPRTPWATMSKPVIGAINGVAITGGFELVLQCDFLVASERAAFGDTHARVGVLPGWGLSVLLPQAIGYRRAVEMSMTGNFMLADEALKLGLVNHVVAHQDLLPYTYELCSAIVGNNTPAIRALLASYKMIHTMTVAEGLRHETQVNKEYGATFKASEVAARREAIRDRGRTQLS